MELVHAEIDTLLEIMDETDDYLVVNKPGNLVCHPTKGDARSSLIGRLRLYFSDQPGVQPSLINRLDRETSGIVLIAKNPKTHAMMQRAFQQNQVQKIYHAIVHGVPSQSEGIVEKALGRDLNSIIKIKQIDRTDGSPSLTNWKQLRASARFSLLEVRPQTGRLHQIRVHLASIGHPIVGDKLYGPDPNLYLEFVRTGWTPNLQKQLLTPRQMLHASELMIRDQSSNQTRTWKAPMPADLQDFLTQYI